MRFARFGFISVRPVLASVVLLLAALESRADMFHMPAGQTSLQFVTVGDPGNEGELSGNMGKWGTRICGSVAYTYRMGKFEITAGQYTQFLNAVAKTDTYGLYNPVAADTSIWSFGCNIQRTGEDGYYTYSVAEDWANRPANYINWGDAARFANWLTNGQPTGPQSAATTEDGSYLLNGATGGATHGITRKTTARYVIPSEDEWYKAAYYDPWKPYGSPYYLFPTHEDVIPGNMDPSTPNTACYAGPNGRSYGIGSPYWRGEVGAFSSSSYYGTFDQGGNVEEWTEGSTWTERIVRGGSFLAPAGYLSSDMRWSLGDFDETSQTGFRIALVPEPAALVTLLCGGLVVVGTRRKHAAFGHR